MRRRMWTLRVRPREEGGATIAIVAISLLALFGMIILVVDVGGLLFKRRELVNGSDAAALAAAKTCAVATDPDNEEVIADTWAMTNVGGLSPDQGGIIADTCREDSGYVTVEYTNPQQLFFAPVLGFGSDSDVTTRATAIWGATGADNPLPIVLNVGTFQGSCKIPDTDQDGGPLEIDDTCYFWYDNNRFDGSNFGFMNLNQWDVPIDHSCSSAGTNERRDWILGGWAGDPLGVNYPDGPTYVCTDSGVSASNWMTLESEIGQMKVFPINDWDGSISGWPQTFSSGTQVDKFQIVGFAAMELSDLLTVAEAGGTNGSCFNTRNFPAASPVSLVTFGNFEGCFTGNPDVITAPVLRQGGTTFQEGVHYTYVPYDPASPATTGIITWIGGTQDNVRIDFDWAFDGVCGQPPGNASARCLVVKWKGDTVTGSFTTQGADFGARAVLLCNPEISGSCDPVTVP